MSMFLRMLVVEDSDDDAALVLREFRRAGYEVISRRVDTAEGMKHALDHGSWEVVIADYALPNFSAPAALSLLKERDLDVPFLIVSGVIGEETAVTAMKSGAHDYIRKNNLARLVPAVERELREAQLRHRHWQAERALRESLQTSADIVRAIPSGLFIYRYEPPDGFFLVHGNPAAGRLTGVDLRAAQGKELRTVWPGVRDLDLVDKFVGVMKTGTVHEEDDLHYRDDRLEATLRVRAFQIPGGQLGVAFEDVTERRRAEELLRLSLQEKEILLRETHHRVKNNLQIISSLLNLQSKHLDEKNADDVFRESQDRIRSMAFIHETLYRSRDLAHVDFGEYVNGLAGHLFRSYREVAEGVVLKVAVDDLPLGIDRAIPCGIIINELVSNALKYAFPKGRKGKISIELHRDEEDGLCLTITDNGVGLPKDVDFRNTDSLGLQLVNTLTDQLNGVVELDRSRGTSFRILFAPERPFEEDQS